MLFDFQACGPLWSYECGSSYYSTGICSRVNASFKFSRTIAPAFQSKLGTPAHLLHLDLTRHFFGWRPLCGISRFPFDHGQHLSMTFSRCEQSKRVPFLNHLNAIKLECHHTHDFVENDNLEIFYACCISFLNKTLT